MAELPKDQKALHYINLSRGYKVLDNGPKLINGTPSKFGVLERLIIEQFNDLKQVLRGDGPLPESARRALGIKSRTHLRKETVAFKDKIRESIILAEDGVTDQEGNYLFYKLRRAFIQGDVGSLATEIKFAFMNSVLRMDYSAQVEANQKALADLRYPIEWFPATRTLQRKIHLHVGPTNSGKTYHALQRLEQAKSGIYAGPLRLLAHEVYTRLNAKGIPCALLTGEERRIPEGVDRYMSSCTVEMVPLNNAVDVAVIDEIQMMGDDYRGWAWTQAFLGVQAKEVHLCGELRTAPLIKKLCAAMGDELIIHEYKRLNPLKVAKESLNGDIRNLRKGDAVILFSRVQLHAMKKHIEQSTGKRCAIVYGSLPPETRAQQAILFNDPDNDYDFLVASDAVGMGLNLSIKRIVFDSTLKFDGGMFQQLSISELKQIAGRAGRYRTSRDATHKQAVDLSDSKPVDIQSPVRLPAQEDPDGDDNAGYVTTLDKDDLHVVRSAFDKDPEALKTASILPPTAIISRFASYFPPSTPFSYILLRLCDVSVLGSCFKLCRIKDQIEISDLIQASSLSIKDRIIFSSAPASLRDPGYAEVVMELAECVARQSNGQILEIKSIPFELLDIKPDEYEAGKTAYLQDIEMLHKAITLYLWLSYRFAGVFQSQALAFHLKDQVEERINDYLDDIDYDAEGRKRLKQLQQNLARQKLVHVPSDATELQQLELAGENDVEVSSLRSESGNISGDEYDHPSEHVNSEDAQTPLMAEVENSREKPRSSALV